MGQKLTHTGQGERKNRNGFISQVDYYEAKGCEGCPLRGMCHISTGNKKIEINHKLNEYKAKTRKY
ncbi:MAG: transposase [Saprospiraceae bacterium]|nr:transposase [Saprospiraceae bacterium]